MTDLITDIRIAQLKASEIELRIQKINDSIKNERILFENKIAPMMKELEELNESLEEHYSSNLRHISVVEWKNQKNGALYLKGTFYCYKPGATKTSTASVHIGKSDDFPMGKNDPRAFELGILKAQKYMKDKKCTIRKG